MSVIGIKASLMPNRRRKAGNMRRGLTLLVVLAALSAAVVIGLVGGRVGPRPDRITVSGDTFALTSSPSSLSGDGDVLVAGGVGGGAAVSYLKFDVSLPPDGALP